MGRSLCPAGHALLLSRGIYDFHPECDEVKYLLGIRLDYYENTDKTFD
jgi:hypothetical protein